MVVFGFVCISAVEPLNPDYPSTLHSLQNQILSVYDEISEIRAKAPTLISEALNTSSTDNTATETTKSRRKSTAKTPKKQTQATTTGIKQEYVISQKEVERVKKQRVAIDELTEEILRRAEATQHNTQTVTKYLKVTTYNQ